MKIGIICGGPSQERGISLNSARSLLDHIPAELVIFYVDQSLRFYKIPTAQLYSNTPDDFDFKLDNTSTHLSRSQLQEELSQVGIVFPSIHGEFGEDGALQDMLKQMNIPFVGSDGTTCRNMYNKDKALHKLAVHGYDYFHRDIISRKESKESIQKKIRHFFNQSKSKTIIVKPTAGGSSIGVFATTTVSEAYNKTQYIFNILNTDVLLEPFCDGREFTIVILENSKGDAVPLIPTEVSISKNTIFSYRNKYLPESTVRYLTPAPFPLDIISTIREQAAAIYKLFSMKDFARLDGYLSHDNKIYFIDFNPISGMEQNSIFFKQTSILGLTHKESLMCVINSACRRHKLPTIQPNATHHHHLSHNKRQPVAVIFGGSNSERQVSLMSGTNVWLKLQQSNKFAPEPFLLDTKKDVWHIPYSYAVNRTVEEIVDNCTASQDIKAQYADLLNEVTAELEVKHYNNRNTTNSPTHYSFNEFLQHIKQHYKYVFIALHGDIGENGTIQKKLEEHQIKFNGSGSKASRVCMDKVATGDIVNAMKHPLVSSLPKYNISHNELIADGHKGLSKVWKHIERNESHNIFIIKPRSDGCSSGVIVIKSLDDLKSYANFVKNNTKSVPPNTFYKQPDIVELSSSSNHYIIEPYITTDAIQVTKQQLHHEEKTGWLELTIGVISKNDHPHAFNPSITIAEGAVLTIEEKFQGGTGINITPPPPTLLTTAQITTIKAQATILFEHLQIKDYCRIDFFFNRKNNEMVIIEINTLPGLTASTVIYHQALAEKNTIYPKDLLESIIEQSI